MNMTSFDKGDKVTLNLSISLGKRQLVDSIWKSAGIEGLGTTFPNTEKILDNLPVSTSRDEVLFVVNMKRAWYFLFDNIDCRNDIMLLRELNKICMDGLIYDPGSLRISPVTIGGTSWVPDMPIESEIVKELKRIDSISDKTDAALEMFCFIARSQMFLDGNKRVAQLACNKILMENDIGIFSVPYDDIDRFKELLVHYYESNDSSDIKSFLYEKCILFSHSV
jgi:Fic family protein